MNVLIAGGTGLIGQALAKTLISNGDQIVILTRNLERVENISSSIEYLKWDGLSINGWANVINDIDAVVNLAGVPISGNNPLKMRWSQNKKAILRASRLNAGKALVDAIKLADKKPKVFVQSSAIGYYGPLDDRVVDESNPGGADFLAKLSREWEASTIEVEKFGVRQVVIRTGLVLAGEGGIFPLLKLQYLLCAGGRMGSGKQYYSWIHILDEVEAIRFLLENDNTQGVFNLTAPNPVSNIEFSKTLGKSLGRPAILPMPAFAMRIFLGEVADLTLTGQRVIPKKLLEAGYQFKYPILGEAIRNLMSVK